MSQTNQITLDFTSNPELSAIFSGKQPGDKVELEVRLQIRDINENQCVGDIEKVTSEDQDEPAEPSPEQPMGIMIAMRPSMMESDEG